MSVRALAALTVLALAVPAQAHDYRVVAGDTLSELAQRFGVSVNGIRTANGIQGDLILVGQVLRIPEEGLGAPPQAKLYRVRWGDTLSELAQSFGCSLSALRQANGIHGDLIRVGQVLRVPGKASAQPTHTVSQQQQQQQQQQQAVAVVHKGDTLSHIALRHGTTVQALMNQNGLIDTLIYPGQRLALPSGSSASEQAPAQVDGSRAARVAALGATQADLEILARIVKGEAPRNTPFEGKVAVAAVVLNRVLSKRWPSSIRRVAHQPWQFSAYNPDVRQRLYGGPIPSWAWAAAQAALAGQDPSGGATHYFNPYLVLPSWAKHMHFIRRIGSTYSTTHDFYR